MMRRPRALLLTLLGAHVVGREIAVATSTFVDVLGRLGVAERTTRSTVNRMVDKGLLQRRVDGRRSFYLLTDVTTALLMEGTPRIVEPQAPRTAERGPWTLISFSLPADRRGERYGLEARLAWDGFGMLRTGLWLAPGHVDVEAIARDHRLNGGFSAFAATVIAPTDIAALARQAWDLKGMAERYEAFMADWRDGGRGVGDLLAREVLLLTDWRHLVREDPLLPPACLPRGWPSDQAYALFRRLYDRCRDRASALFEEALDAIPLSPQQESATGGGTRERPLYLTRAAARSPNWRKP